MIEEAEKNSRRIYGGGSNWRRGSGKYGSFGRKNYEDEHRHRRDDGSHEKRKTDSRDREGQSRNRSRSSSRECDRRRSPNHYNDRQFYGDRKKMNFMRPTEDEHSSASSSRKSSSTIKRWQKPNANNTFEERRKETHRSENRRKQSQKSSSDQDQSDDDSDNKETIKNVDNKKSDGDEEIMTEAEMNQLGAKIVKAEIMGDAVRFIKKEKDNHPYTTFPLHNVLESLEKYETSLLQISKIFILFQMTSKISVIRRKLKKFSNLWNFTLDVS